MKIILSRKGFDGNSGKFPSIVYKNNFYSFPIPQIERNGIPYSELKFSEQKAYSDVFQDLGIKIKTTNAHLDPDLKKSIIKNRNKEWKPLFGQAGSAEAHLENQKVNAGDIFLFFGWFKFTQDENGKINYIHEDKDYVNGFHVIFGYLEVEKKFNLLTQDDYPDWTIYHPHILNKELYNNKKHNSIYISKNNFSFNTSKKGAGLFNFHDSLILTKKNSSKGIWTLDNFFSQTSRFNKFQNSNDDKTITVNLKGYYPQELMITENSAVKEWTVNLISTYGEDNDQ